MNAETVYNALLQLYPKEFRAQHGLEMLQTFRAAHAKAKLEHQLPRFWFGIVTDAISSAIREHAQAKGWRGMSPMVRVGAVCFVLGGLLNLYAYSRIVWADEKHLDVGLTVSVLVMMLYGVALVGLKVSRPASETLLGKLGFAALWASFLSGALYVLAFKLLQQAGFLASDSSPYGLPPANASLRFQILSQTYQILNRVEPLTSWLFLFGFVAVAFGRLGLFQRRLAWREIPPESLVLLLMVAWSLMRIIFPALAPRVAISGPPPRAELIAPVVLMSLPETLFGLALGVVLWLKSSSSRLPPRARPT